MELSIVAKCNVIVMKKISSFYFPVSEFWVVVQRNDAATRCGLQGSYWLQVGQEALLLRETQKNIVREWPYELLRRYGKDKVRCLIS